MFEQQMYVSEKLADLERDRVRRDARLEMQRKAPVERPHRDASAAPHPASDHVARRRLMLRWVR